MMKAADDTQVQAVTDAVQGTSSGADASPGLSSDKQRRLLQFADLVVAGVIASDPSDFLISVH